MAYFSYGRILEQKVVHASNAKETPARRLYDGFDYVPTRREVLFGHHFSSIAGVAPIVGPALALCWGWLPGILWVWFGNIFIGAVHDYLALMASVRHDGKSIQFVTVEILGKRTGKAFYGISFFFLVMIIASLGTVLGSLFIRTPQIASTFLWTTIAALILGVLIYRLKNVGFSTATIVGIILLAASITLGILFPIQASYTTWMVVFFFYIIIASALPVHTLLQPRDYLNSFLLYTGILIGLVGTLFAFRGFEIPVVTTFSPLLSAGKPTPLWPAMPLIIACGALSGLHSLVGSGTSSKQLPKESDGLLIGYGGMLTEGFLSTMVIAAIAGFGYTAIQKSGADMGIDVMLNPTNWAALFTSTTESVELTGANLFIESYTDMIAATWLGIIPAEAITVIAGMWVAAFGMTTLDTANRLGRYCITEVFSSGKTGSRASAGFLTNRFFTSFIPALLGIYLAWSGNLTVLWPTFGAANLLIASIALMTGAWYIKHRLGSRYYLCAVIPAWLIWTTATAALLWFMAVVIPALIAEDPGTGWTVMIICLIMVITNVTCIIDCIAKGKKASSQASIE
ncbi:MAG: carbon starvation protein A [Deltaproteobacteria bacterium]|nr:carbon starvation protein A [Deltaproteobacteria bacterium]